MTKRTLYNNKRGINPPIGRSGVLPVSRVEGRRGRRRCARVPDLLPAHVTGSAWVVSPDREQALLLLHGKHHRWFQPGGHADGQADILQVALRETHEETGLAPEQIRLVEEDVFDLDIHTIPASPHFPMHEHIDVRFLLEIDDRLPVPGSDESNDILWVPLQHVSRYNNCRSLWRMVEKTRRLRTYQHTHLR